MDVMMKMSHFKRSSRIVERPYYISVTDTDPGKRVHFECVLWIGADP